MSGSVFLLLQSCHSRLFIAGIQDVRASLISDTLTLVKMRKRSGMKKPYVLVSNLALLKETKTKD